MSFDIKSVNGRHNLLLFIFIMVVKEMAQVTQISMARTYYLTTGPQATDHNIILTLNCSQSYSSGRCVSLSWSLHLLNWDQLNVIWSLWSVVQGLFLCRKWILQHNHPAPSIFTVYKYWINTAALTCLEQYFPKIYVYFRWPSLVLQVKKRLYFYWCRTTIFPHR